jgi:hypothetical protein
MGKKEFDAVNEALGQGKNMGLGEIGDPGPIEVATEQDIISKAVQLEKFMHEPVTLVIHPSTEEGALEVVTPSVNGINQPIVRGVETTVKRKYVEALARGRMTRYEQQTPDPTRPENIQMLDRTALIYPFTVVNDANPRGREWLKGILSQP